MGAGAAFLRRPLLSFGQPQTHAGVFNFSANHLFLLQRKEYRSCAVLLLLDGDTQRVYRLHDFTKAHRFQTGTADCITGKVNSADKLYLVIETVKLDAKHQRSSTVPVSADGAEGNAL
jgi:hypothetical protein